MFVIKVIFFFLNWSKILKMVGVKVGFEYRQLFKFGLLFVVLDEVLNIICNLVFMEFLCIILW